MRYRHARNTGYLNAPVAVTVGSSPQTVVNSDACPEDLVVKGGTVTKIEISRDGGSTWVDVGVTAGLVGLSPGDRAKVTSSDTTGLVLTLVPR